jgi:phosphatidylserine decarboxylase
MKERRHFPGLLLSVSQFALRNFPDLLSHNERVVLWGNWAHGVFAFCPVAATNVGNIFLVSEPEFTTNLSSKAGHSIKRYDESLEIEKGEEIGMFRLGSTIVLFFESAEFEFFCKEGQPVQMGQSLGQLKTRI